MVAGDEGGLGVGWGRCFSFVFYIFLKGVYSRAFCASGSAFHIWAPL